MGRPNRIVADILIREVPDGSPTSSNVSTTEARIQSRSYTEIADDATHSEVTSPVPPKEIQRWFRNIQKALDSDDDRGLFDRLYHRFKDEGPLPKISDSQLAGRDWEKSVRRRWLRQLMLWLGLKYRVLPAIMQVKVTGVNNSTPDAMGGFADIFKATCNGRAIALKRFRGTHKTDENTIRHSYQECMIWWNLSHPFVLFLIGVDMEAFLKHNILLPITPWMNKGNILEAIDSLIAKEKSVAHILTTICTWLNHIMLGLAYIHSEGIVHGDLRGPNILIDDNNSALLADFGLCAFSDVEGRNFATLKGGADPWLAPEMFDPNSESDRQTCSGDIFSLACVFIELYTGKAPWFGTMRAKISALVLAGRRPQRPSFRGTLRMSDKIWDFVQLCWAQHPAERPTSEGALEKFEEIINPRSVRNSHLLMLQHFIMGEISFRRLFAIDLEHNVQLRSYIEKLLYDMSGSALHSYKRVYLPGVGDSSQTHRHILHRLRLARELLEDYHCYILDGERLSTRFGMQRYIKYSGVLRTGSQSQLESDTTYTPVGSRNFGASMVHLPH